MDTVLDIGQSSDGIKVQKRQKNAEVGAPTIKKGVCPELDDLRAKYEKLDQEMQSCLLSEIDDISKRDRGE